MNIYDYEDSSNQGWGAGAAKKFASSPVLVVCIVCIYLYTCLCVL